RRGYRGALLGRYVERAISAVARIDEHAIGAGSGKRAELTVTVRGRRYRARLERGSTRCDHGNGQGLRLRQLRERGEIQPDAIASRSAEVELRHLSDSRERYRTCGVCSQCGGRGR